MLGRRVRTAQNEGEPTRRSDRDRSDLQKSRDNCDSPVKISLRNNKLETQRPRNTMTATEQLDTALAHVQSAAIDGRMRNTRTRQKQLSSLFKSLTEHSNFFVDAMQKENNLSREEANIVVSAMLLEVRQHYENIDFKKELAQEYSVRWGKSWVDRRVPARIVYIIPQDFTKSFNVFSALSAAIEAGSCCVVEVKDSYCFATEHRLTKNIATQSVGSVHHSHSNSHERRA